MLHRTEVVVDESEVGAGLLREPAGGDVGIADLDEKTFGGVEEDLFGCVAIIWFRHSWSNLRRVNVSQLT